MYIKVFNGDCASTSTVFGVDDCSTHERRRRRLRQKGASMINGVSIGHRPSHVTIYSVLGISYISLTMIIDELILLLSLHHNPCIVGQSSKHHHHLHPSHLISILLPTPHQLATSTHNPRGTDRKKKKGRAVSRQSNRNRIIADLQRENQLRHVLH